MHFLRTPRVRDLKTDFTPSDFIKDTPEMKALALQYQQIGTRYKSDVTNIFTASVEFQKTKHIETDPGFGGTIHFSDLPPTH
jgi:hypothetical protein